MSLDRSFAYAQARIQARFAGLPAEDEWQRLAASRTLASFLEEARTGALRNWVKGFSGLSDIHDLEAGLRSQYRENLEAVAGWVPVPWREAVVWTRWLALLPLLAHLQAGNGMPSWAKRDRDLGALLGEGSRLDPSCLERAGAECLLQSGDGLVAAWFAEWRRRWPRCARATSQDLGVLVAQLMEHAQTFPGLPSTAAWRSRQGLRERLRLRFHQRTLRPSLAFIYLALTALDLERLRAALVTRALFAVQDEQVRSARAGRAAG